MGDTYVELHALRELASMREDLTTLERREGSERAGVESRILEAQAPVHTVGRQLQGHLFNVPLQKRRPSDVSLSKMPN